MAAFIRRLAVVTVVAVLLLLSMQFIFSRDDAIDKLDDDFKPTHRVSIQDVLKADLPSPAVQTVSFPKLSYREAFPDSGISTDDIIQINEFHEAPILADLDSMPERYRGHYPDALPPVAERLPENPLVIRGPDGIGKYGGTLRRCTNETIHVAHKMMPESFTRFDPSGRLMPALAWKWEVADGNRVFTFYLRKGHKWSDGEPFTTEDILWVCNTLIGSAYWSSLPNWMQSTDGRSQLYVSDITDWGRLLERLQLDINAMKKYGTPTVGGLIAGVAPKSFDDLLEHLQKNPDDTLSQHKLTDMLNQVFRNTEYYKEEAFGAIDVISEKQKLINTGASRLSKEQIERLILLYERDDLIEMHRTNAESMDETAIGKLGLLMFRAAYSDCVEIARVKRVIVEAIPDENGDSSHIVRFTFPRPNSIFLEKTATFMFFRGIFVLSKHYTAPFHPAGSDILNTIDILDWNAFGEKLRTEISQRSDSPLGRLAAVMDQESRATIAKQLSATELSAQDKQYIVDAINAALHNREFFSPDVWSSVDYRNEYDEVTSVGFIKLRSSRADLNRCRQLLVRADLLRRFEHDGIIALSDDDVYKLNLMMFRAALDRRNYPENPIVAFNREDALNKKANNHPRKYSSWVTFMRSLGNYHPEYNRHYPTLRPWRKVTEKSEKDSLHIRNPYYYRVDEKGNQLPYIDALETSYEAEESIRLLKMSSGNIDFQVSSLGFENFTYLKEHEKQGHYRIGLWAPDSAGGIFFYPLQAHKDPEFSKLQEDSRFRHALSLALNRQEIVDVCFDGLAIPAQYAVPKGSRYYSDYHANMSVEYDPAKANQLLDDMGLDVRDASGYRTFPGGQRSLIMNIDTSDQRTSKIVMMACEYWRKIGLNVQMQLRTSTVIDRMISIGILDIGAAVAGSSYFGPLLAGGYAPTHPAECGQWGKWTSYIREGGRTGWPAPQRLREIDMLWENVLGAANEQDKLEAWEILSRRTADDLARIGVYTEPGSLVYRGRRIRNVPELSLSGWIAHSPGNCCPEIFWLDDDSTEASPPPPNGN